MSQQSHARSLPVLIPVGQVCLRGDLTVPTGADGIVLFAHGCASSRHTPRNQFVARILEQQGLATLLINLLTPDEEALDEHTAHLRFDIGLLASRLVAIIDWLQRQPELAQLQIGLFGASTSGGAALVAASFRPRQVRAVISRGGRPDLAGSALRRVVAPTLLIVGGRDTAVIDMNRCAKAEMHGDVTLEIIRGATHLFEEPGSLRRVAELAAEFFADRLQTAETIPAAAALAG